MTEYMTRLEAADYCRTSPWTIDRWAREGRLTKYKVDGTQSVRFNAEEVKALIVPVGASACAGGQ